MRILLINNFHYRKGGSETVYFNMAEMLVRHGHEVLFFSCTDSRNEPSAQSEYFVRSNATLPKIKGVIHYFYNNEARRNLEKLIADFRPDIAHVHLFWGGISPSIFGVLQKHSIPLVHTVHDYRMVCPAYTFRAFDGHICEECRGRHFYKCILHRCSKGQLLHSTVMAMEMYLRNRIFNPIENINGFVFVSKFAQSKHIQYMPGFAYAKSIVAYNTVQPLDDSFVNREKGNYFLFFGRLSHEKGVDTLINAFLSKRNYNLKIVGTGPEEAALRKRVALAGADNIWFEGYRSGDELKRIIRDSSFIIVPSEWYENNPMTIIEAYAAGIPVIGANIGGIPEIVSDGETGFLFTPTDVESLSKCINKAISTTSDDYLRMSRNASAFAEKNFNEEKNYEKLITLYKSLLHTYEK